MLCEIIVLQKLTIYRAMSSAVFCLLHSWNWT